MRYTDKLFILVDSVNKFLLSTYDVLNDILGILEDIDGSETDPALKFSVEKMCM